MVDDCPGLRFLPGRQLARNAGLVSLQVGLELRRPGRLVLFLQGEPGGQILLIGRQRNLGRGDRGQAVAFELGPPKCELDLALAQVFGQLAVVVVDRLQVVPAGRDLLGRPRGRSADLPGRTLDLCESSKLQAVSFYTSLRVFDKSCLHYITPYGVIW